MTEWLCEVIFLYSIVWRRGCYGSFHTGFFFPFCNVCAVRVCRKIYAKNIVLKGVFNIQQTEDEKKRIVRRRGILYFECIWYDADYEQKKKIVFSLWEFTWFLFNNFFIV